MSAWMLWVVTALYALTSLDMLSQGKLALSMIFASYAAANIGLLIITKS